MMRGDLRLMILLLACSSSMLGCSHYLVCQKSPEKAEQSAESARSETNKRKSKGITIPVFQEYVAVSSEGEASLLRLADTSQTCRIQSRCRNGRSIRIPRTEIGELLRNGYVRPAPATGRSTPDPLKPGIYRALNLPPIATLEPRSEVSSKCQCEESAEWRVRQEQHLGEIKDLIRQACQTSWNGNCCSRSCEESKSLVVELKNNPYLTMDLSPTVLELLGRISDRKIIGELTGRLDGTLDGRLDGTLDGRLDGRLDGNLDGRLDGRLDGTLEGSLDGTMAGSWTGDIGRQPSQAIFQLPAVQDARISSPQKPLKLISAEVRPIKSDTGKAWGMELTFSGNLGLLGGVRIDSVKSLPADPKQKVEVKTAKEGDKNAIAAHVSKDECKFHLKMIDTDSGTCEENSTSKPEPNPDDIHLEMTDSNVLFGKLKGLGSQKVEYCVSGIERQRKKARQEEGKKPSEGGSASKKEDEMEIVPATKKLILQVACPPQLSKVPNPN